MADEQPTGSEPVENTQQQQQPEQTKQAQSNQESTPVKSTEQKQDEKPSVQMRNFNGYEIPEPIYKELSTSKFSEGQRKALKELEESGKILTDDKVEQLKEYQTLMESFSNVLKPGEKLSTQQVHEIIQKQKNEAADQFKSKLKLKDKEIEESRHQLESLVNTIKTKRQDEVIRNALMKNESINHAMVEDALTLIKYEGVILVDEDMESVKVVDKQTKEARFNKTTGDNLTVQEFVDEWLSKKPGYLKSASTAGAGVNYGNGKASKPTFSDALRAGMPQNPIKKSSK